MKRGTVLAVFMICCLGQTLGHGILIDPLGRSSLWRVNSNFPTNYNDRSLNCGGFHNQWEVNDGKCGVCGDPFQGPRPNEPPGMYAKGIIARSYREGMGIPVQVRLSANHKGYMEFRLCQHNDPKTTVTQDCLDQNLLTIVGYGTRYPVSASDEWINLEIQLPMGVTCNACVMQWTYNTGNNWGKDIKTGKQCIGCGHQEQFKNCADVEIVSAARPGIGVPESSSLPSSRLTSLTTTTLKSLPTSTMKATAPNRISSSVPTKNTHAAVNILTGTPSTGQCSAGFEPKCACVRKPTPAALKKHCYPIGDWVTVRGMDGWCQITCTTGACPSAYCRCD